LIPAPQKPQPMRMQANNPEGPQGAGTQGKGTSQQSESGYDRVYRSATDKPRGMPLGMKQVREQYGEHGVNTVERTQQKAQDIIDSGASKRSRGPVVSGITDPATGKTYFGQNFTEKERNNLDFMASFKEQLHPLLKERLETHTQKLETGKVKAEFPTDLDKGGIPGTHSEVQALDQALKAREVHTGNPITEAELSSFLLHNRSLNNVTGVPPRCAHCWHLTDGITVIGND
jgi:YwqJ-like deaminase